MKKFEILSFLAICIVLFFICKSKKQETILYLSHLPKMEDKCIKIEKFTGNKKPGYYVCEYSVTSDEYWEILTAEHVYNERGIQGSFNIYNHYYVSNQEFSKLKLNVGESLPEGKFRRDFKRDSVLIRKTYFSNN